MEQPVRFINRNGFHLFGMIYAPAGDATPRTGVIISVNAIKYRLGTFRLHTLLARQLCALGYFVFCFDPEGVGDSEGEMEFKTLTEHYYDIQTGKYNNDLADAIDFFTRECQLDSLVLAGLCGGAISVLMAGADVPRVDGMVLLNLPVLVEDLSRKGGGSNAAKITSKEMAGSLLNQKIQRLLQLNFWWRLITLRVDIREEASLVAKSISVLAKKMLTKIKQFFASKGVALQLTEPVSTNPLYSMYFQNAFSHSMAAGKKLFFLFAALDPWTWIFKSEFQDHVLPPGNCYEKRCEIDVIDNANHIFSGSDSQQQLLKNITGWLTQNFPLHRPS